MKIAMLMDKPLPTERATGIGVVGYELSKALSRQGVSVTLICRGNRTQIPLESNHFSIRTIPHYTTRLPMEVLQAYRKEGFDLIHAHTASTLLGCLLTRLLGKPLVRHTHGSGQDLARKILFELSDWVVAVSRYVQEELPSRLRRKISVVYNGADTELFRSLEADAEVATKYGLASDARIILSLGMVQRRKGQRFVVEVMAKLAKHFPDVLYVNVGKAYSTPYLEDLRSFAESHVPGRVKFLSNVPASDLVHLINLANLCVHPSLIDACPVAVAEEMSCGKPIVAFRNSAIPELIDHGDNGLLVGTGDLKGLADAIGTLLTDTDLADNMGHKARQKVLENFTWEKAAKDVLSIYREIV